MANTTLTWINRRELPTADWDNISQASDQITNDLQMSLSNTEIALTNDAYMLGSVSSTISYVNSTCVEATHTLTGNTTFINESKQRHAQHKLALQNSGYIITEL